ncbi:hypothetical protein diail_599 [Diaporthe ilicicola]|nr:hypothetical protein diail_599 [Diaporthe ilicicola]
MVPFTIGTVLRGMLAHPESPDLFRIRIQPEHAAGGPIVKYLTGPNSSRLLLGFRADLRRAAHLAFDTIPAGNWVVGRLAPVEEDVDGEPGKLRLASIEPDNNAALHDLGLCSAETVWCGTTVDEADCQGPPSSPRFKTVVTAAGKEVAVPNPIDLQCMGYGSASIISAPAQCSTDEEEVVLVTDWLPGHWRSIEHEARTNELIQARDPGLAPRLLAHVTENHTRVIGFLLERIHDAREAGPEDLDGCRAALARLHALGIARGDLRRHSFLVRSDGSVLVQGPFTRGPDDIGEDIDEVMSAEMESLETVLARSPPEFEGQWADVLRQVNDPDRMMLFREFEDTHGFCVPFVYWQDSRKGGGHITLTVEQHGVLARRYEENGFRWTEELQEQAEKEFGPTAEAV